MPHPPTTTKTTGGFTRVWLSQLDHPLSLVSCNLYYPHIYTLSFVMLASSQCNI